MRRDFFPPAPPTGGPRPTWGDALLALVVTGLDILAYLAPGDEGMPGTRFTVLGVLLVVAAAPPLLFRRHHPLPVLGVVLAVQCAVNLGLAVDPGTPMTNSYGGAVTVALYTVARYCGSRTLALAFLAALPVQLLRGVLGDLAVANMAVDVLVTPALVIGAGLGVRQWKWQLDINRRLLADRAVGEERRRIARELHDIVAHHITTMYLMSGGARSTLDRDPETAREALVTLEESGRTALREMRQLLGVLRSTDSPEETPSEPQPGVDGIERLVADANVAGLSAELHVTGQPRPLPESVGLTLYRIVQEALTNARKHAGPARATVRLCYLPDRVTVEVADDGAGDGRASGGAVRGGGYGLLGMRERIALHDGSLRVGSRTGGGFEVAASVPLPIDAYEKEGTAR
ncbi:sensor histidine kinase [Streptomyces sp. NPDC046465]|uniref:sensor histidine kinase n=1 Tax=Streptomyces sp. NPDC046465 TaxID=3155810 RepID=UPI003409153E